MQTDEASAQAHVRCTYSVEPGRKYEKQKALMICRLFFSSAAFGLCLFTLVYGALMCIPILTPDYELRQNGRNHKMSV